MDDLTCDKHNCVLLCTAGENAHRSNWYCPACDEIESLQSRIDELENPGWAAFIEMCEQWLTNYPPDIFDGSSGDPGPLFVVALRKAINDLPTPPEKTK